MYTVINGLLYTFGWLLCVLSGAKGASWLPVLATCCIVISELIYWKFKDRAVFYSDLLILGYGVIFGFLMEIIFISTGIVEYATVNILVSVFPPAWIWCLYFLFALTFNHSLHFLNRHPLLPLIFGAIGGPFSYYVGQELGAVAVHSYLSLSIGWGLYMMGMFRLNIYLKKIVSSTMSIEGSYTILFDSVCPICAKEIHHLKKRKGEVSFFDLASGQHYPDVDYLEAMKEIHGVKENGQILKGIDAFVELYKRKDLTFLAICLQIPIFNLIANTLYPIWAKYRLKNRCKIKPI